MKNQFITVIVLCVFILGSCKKIESIRRRSRGTLSLVVPANFDWKSTRTIKFLVSLSDQRFGNSVNMIAIYDGDPESGGKLLSKGAATTTTPFATRIALSNHLTSVFLVKTAPDNTSLTTKIGVNIADIEVTLGQ